MSEFFYFCSQISNAHPYFDVVWLLNCYYTNALCVRTIEQLLWPIKKDGDNPVNQSKLEVITCSRHTKRGKMCTRERRLVLVSLLIGWKTWCENFEPRSNVRNEPPFWKTEPGDYHFILSSSHSGLAIQDGGQNKNTPALQATKNLRKRF